MDKTTTAESETTTEYGVRLPDGTEAWHGSKSGSSVTVLNGSYYLHPDNSESTFGRKALLIDHAGRLKVLGVVPDSVGKPVFLRRQRIVTTLASEVDE